MLSRRILTLAALGLGLASPSWAVDQNDIDQAVARGVRALRQMQRGEDGSWTYPERYTPGATAMVGLTLLECGAKENDVQVQKAANYIRGEAPTMTKTYSISASIMFLDRLGDPGDVPLIESLTVRLLAGQGKDAGWSYECPSVSEEEVARLRTTVKNRTELKSGQLPMGKRTFKDVSKEVQAQVAQVVRMEQQGGAAQLGSFGSDNSNTQFATLAMWIGRRHGLPVEHALARVAARFRRTQSQDGTWHYFSGTGGPGGGNFVAAPSAGMTCAAALGLAVGHGLANDPDIRKGQHPPDLAKDAVLQKALAALGSSVGKPGSEPPTIGQENGRAYYFLWSLERVAMALNLETLGDKDWYTWGTEVLLANQDNQGTWRGAHTEAGMDTCFALLFLRRSNLVKDISANLKGLVKDPAKIELSSGGVGGTAFVKAGKDLKSPFEKEKREADPREKGTDKPRTIPTRVEETEEDRLSKKLLEAKGAEWDRVLTELRGTKGGQYTSALALAIPQLEGEPRQKARDALAGRMYRLAAATLVKDMKDADPEIRRAAVIASASKILDGNGVRAHIEHIIGRLNDDDASVAHAAAAVLKKLTKQNFGPEFGASREDHDKAVAEWKKWWKENADK